MRDFAAGAMDAGAAKQARSLAAKPYPVATPERKLTPLAMVAAIPLDFTTQQASPVENWGFHANPQ
jgi:hypothetical protein